MPRPRPTPRATGDGFADPEDDSVVPSVDIAGAVAVPDIVPLIKDASLRDAVAVALTIPSDPVGMDPETDNTAALCASTTLSQSFLAVV